MNLDDAIKLVKSECPNKSALAYANAIPLAVSRDGTRGLYAQIAYILANTNNWRGKRARKAKEVMRQYMESREYKKPKNHSEICS